MEKPTDPRMKPQNQAPEGVQTRAMEAAAVNTATAPPQSPSPQRTQPPPQLPSQQRMPQLSTSPQRTQPSRPMPGTPTLRPPAPRAPAAPATSGIPAAGRPQVPPRVTVHLAPYNGLSSVVQWWLNFLSYVQLYQLTDDQAINILPFYFTEPVKHWFYQLEANARSSLSQFKLAFFSRFRKNDEDLDLDDIKQGQEEDIDSFLFRLQQAASDLNITEVELTKKAVKGLRQNIRGHVYMRKPRTMEDLRQEAKLVERGLNMSNPIGDDITATIQASVNAAVSSMQQLMAPVSAMESDPTNRPPNRPPLHQYQQRQQHQQNQQHQQHHQQSSRQESMRGKRVCFNCGESCLSKSHCRAKDEKCYYCGNKGHFKRVCKDYLLKKALGLEQ